MPDNLFIELIDEPIYTKVCHLRGTRFQGHEITLYVECRENLDSERSDDYYEISFSFTADGYGNRQFVIGIFAGSRGMTQQEMDDLIISWIRDVIADEVESDMDHYLMKEHLYEQWLESQEGEKE